MSLDNITKDYNNQYKLKGITPEWLTLLTKNVNSRNISTVDWNIAMDDIRKVASDSVAVHDFIEAFNNEFNAFYNRGIKHIYYTTDTEDKLSTDVMSELSVTAGNFIKNSKVKFNLESLDKYRFGTGEEVFYCSGYENSSEDVGFKITFKEDTDVWIKYLQLYVRGVYADVPIKIAIEYGSGTSLYTEFRELCFCKSSELETYLVSIQQYVKSITIVQPAYNGSTNGRFSICGLEMFDSNVTGSWVIERYDGVQHIIPMVNPHTFNDTMSLYVNTAYKLSKDAEDYRDKAVEAKDSASAYNDSAQKWAQGTYVTTDPQYNVSAKDYATRSSVSEVNAAKSAEDAADSLLELKNTIADSTDKTNTALKLLRLDSNGLIPAQFLPTEKTIEMFAIKTEADLTTLSDARIGDIAYIVNEDGDADYNYRLVDDDYSDRKNWILQTTSYVAQAATAEKAKEADNATRINGTLLRIGSSKDYNPADTEGVYIITDYSEGGTSNA